MVSPVGDDLVASVKLFRPKHWALHAYCLPYIFLYPAWLFLFFGVWGADHFELGAITGVAVLITQALCGLFCFWSVRFKSWAMLTPEDNVMKASLAVVVPTPNNGSAEVVRIHRSLHKEEPDSTPAETIWFMFQKTKYVLDEEKHLFRGLTFPVDHSFGYYNTWRGHETDESLAENERHYGTNQLEMVIPEFLELFIERATAPFFVFQVFCVGLWCLDEYWYYSLFTLFMLVTFEYTLVQQQLRNMAEIRKMGNKPYQIQVYRKGRWKPISSDQLVPGDLVGLGRSQSLVPCDILLLRGQCIVDESTLTGESVPQIKEAIDTLNPERFLDIEADGKLHVVAGGTKIVQHSAPSSTSGLRGPTASSCVGYVLRTGFNTSQGKLLRTILFGVKRVTANTKETAFFILFLLIFAIAAASYLWIKGSENPSRNRYKLFLECVFILTSVVPPELPIELSLAVNSSLLALSRLMVFCTEPFRIPFAGKVDICCFDKTGTLTSDTMVVEGIAGLRPAEKPSENGSASKEDSPKPKGRSASPSRTRSASASSSDARYPLTPVGELPLETVQVLASCHSLVTLESENDALVGDPLEKATINAIDWNVARGDVVVPKKGRAPGMKIYHRFYFASALKRMSVIAGYQLAGTSTTFFICATKGAPEILKPMFVSLPNDYDETYLEYARRGARVLALGRRELGTLTAAQVREMTREAVEQKLHFQGFLIISCPLKPDSRVNIREVLHASHAVCMITGDNPLTACHVARELRFARKPFTLVLTKREDVDGSSNVCPWTWLSVDEMRRVDLVPKNVDKDLLLNYDLCVTGEGLSYLVAEESKFLKRILPHVKVFARFNPKQKEFVITTLNEQGFVTLMCGDGTNDVGALKHANVGVAILSSVPESSRRPRRGPEENGASTPDASAAAQPAPAVGPRGGAGNRAVARNRRDGGGHDPASRRHGPVGSANRADVARSRAQAELQRLMKEMEEMEAPQIVKLGDASIAAPFTSKMTSIQCVSHIIKQGRCTLVTTLQMFKILALNALILAYSQSVLYLQGIKFSDGQATFQGLLLAACFLFISKSKPLKTLSKQRPLPNIFNPYTVLTVIGQFAIHFTALVYLVQECYRRMPQNDSESGFVDLDKEFEPNLLNSTVYVISMALQVATFGINYRGHPFMESLWENRSLFYSIAATSGFIFAVALNLIPEFQSQFQMVHFPDDFRWLLVQVLLADYAGAWLVDRLLLLALGEGRQRVK
jgi:cation-transporting ATPase 13A1